MFKAYPKEEKAHTMISLQTNNVDLTPIKSPIYLVKNYIPTVWGEVGTTNLTAQHFSWFAEKGQALGLDPSNHTERPRHEDSANQRKTSQLFRI